MLTSSQVLTKCRYTTMIYTTLMCSTSHRHSSISGTTRYNRSSIFTFVHSSSSGARYHSVTTIGVYAFSGDPYSLASPKSPTFRMPLWLKSRFDVLRSLCRIQLSWRWATARRSCCMRHFTSPEGETKIRMCTSSKANMCKNTYFNDTQTYQMSLIIVPRHVSYCHV